MFQKRQSLVFRIALPFALLLILAMTVLTAYLSSHIQESYLSIMRTNLQAETRLVADRMAALMLPDIDQQAIDQQAKRYAVLLNVRVTVIDANGNVLGESAASTQDMESHIDRPEIQRALQNESTTEMRFSETVHTEMLYAASPIQDGGRIIGVARLAVSLSTVRRSITDLFNTVLIATGAATLLTILVSILVAWYTIAPLKKLTTTAQHVAEGRLEEIETTARRDEIGQLQQSIQRMSHHLKSQLTDMRIERGKLEAVLSNMTDGVIIVDREGLVQLINPAALRLFRVEEKQSLYRSLIEVVRHHQLVELWRKSQASGEQEVTTLETSPERLFVQGIATPLATSMPGMILLVFQDLTRVRRLETVRRDFVSNVSHELRTPLASLKALTETLQEGALEDPPAARRFLQRMETEIDNLTQIVHELLELSRIESGKVPLHLVPVAPYELTISAVERMQLQAERAGLQLSLDCPQDIPLVRADPVRIEQVLVNLVHNAIKFTPPGGFIQVSVVADKNQVIFSIRDSGAGIPPEVLPRIFERFYKVDRARSSGGTGLGLSIARHLIEAHGGRIWAESALNQGSNFSFSLPVAS